MKPRGVTIRLALVAATVATAVGGCPKASEPKASEPNAQGAAAGGAAGGASSGPVSVGPLAGVIDPWSWPRAAGATAREMAIEDIGPYEPRDPRHPAGALVNTNAYYWTRLVGLAWDRDVDLDFDGEPVDLDGD